MIVVAPPSVTLRCHRCSHAIGLGNASLRIVALFKPSAIGDVQRSGDEVRRRCQDCTWVNVFRPENGRPAVELK